jgi:hypothetical protein
VNILRTDRTSLHFVQFSVSPSSIQDGTINGPHGRVHVSLNLKVILHVLITVYSGGLEMLFSDQRKHKISIPTLDEEKQPSNVAFLIRWLCHHLMKDPRKEMFVLDDSV